MPNPSTDLAKRLREAADAGEQSQVFIGHAVITIADARAAAAALESREGVGLEQIEKCIASWRVEVASSGGGLQFGILQMNKLFDRLAELFAASPPPAPSSQAPQTEEGGEATLPAAAEVERLKERIGEGVDALNTVLENAAKLYDQLATAIAERDAAQARVRDREWVKEVYDSAVAACKQNADELAACQAECERLRLEAKESCPCAWGNPCHDRCPCVDSLSSASCTRCCRYGSEEQQREAARILIAQEAEVAQLRSALSERDERWEKLRARLRELRKSATTQQIWTLNVIENFILAFPTEGESGLRVRHEELQAILGRIFQADPLAILLKAGYAGLARQEGERP